MRKENKNNYYKNEDEIIFEKLNNFKKFNSNTQNNNQSKNHNIKYSNSDKNYFNNILKTKKNDAFLNNSIIDKETSYYNSSDFQKFNRLNNFPEYKDNTEHKNNENISSKLPYTSSDYGEFDKIVKTKKNEENIKTDQNRKVKIIDYGKLKERENKLKNKLGIEKIKIIYFD
tara:strand:- start:151 stop:666 length:516 start_codon:yes stop_codon:yes gene_type:complete